MKTYTVKEIADILKTNPETVRRWIRLGKLEADQSSRKSGNVVTEQSLSKFLKAMPKYAGIAAGTMSLLSFTGFVSNVPILTATLLGTMIAQKGIIEERLRNAQIPVSEMLKFIETSIKDSEKMIYEKKEEISKLEIKIKEEEQHIQDLKDLLNKLNSQRKKSTSDRKEK